MVHTDLYFVFSISYCLHLIASFTDHLNLFCFVLLITELKHERMELEAQQKETLRKLQIEVQSRERMESEWVGVSSKKGEIESLHMTVVGDKVKLEAQVELLNQAVANKQQVCFVSLNAELLMYERHLFHRKLFPTVFGGGLF